MGTENTEKERLETLNRLASLGEIAAEVAHELRNALQIISSNAYLAQRAAPAGSDPQFLRKIERSARLAHGIVDDVMALATHATPTDIDPADPTPLADILATARELLPAADYEDHADGVTVRVQAGLCARLFHVLYDNAIRAAVPARARIVTRAAPRQGGGVTIDVSDDGPGVPPELRETLFDTLVTARPGGTGLGLALARRIAAAHKTTIALVPGTSATFRITFP